MCNPQTFHCHWASMLSNPWLLIMCIFPTVRLLLMSVQLLAKPISFPSVSCFRLNFNYMSSSFFLPLHCSGERFFKWVHVSISQLFGFAAPARLPGFHVCVGSGGERLLPEWYKEKGDFTSSLHLIVDLPSLGRVSMTT